MMGPIRCIHDFVNYFSLNIVFQLVCHCGVERDGPASRKMLYFHVTSHVFLIHEYVTLILQNVNERYQSYTLWC